MSWTRPRAGVFGTETEIQIPSLANARLQGTGAAKGSMPKTCDTCNGQGQVRVSSPFSPSAAPVRAARARQDHQQSLDTCYGQGRVRQEKTLPVSVPAGVDTGDRNPLNGEARQAGTAVPAGDLYVEVRAANTPSSSGRNPEQRGPDWVSRAIFRYHFSVERRHFHRPARPPQWLKLTGTFAGQIGFPPARRWALFDGPGLRHQVSPADRVPACLALRRSSGSRHPNRHPAGTINRQRLLLAHATLAIAGVAGICWDDLAFATLAARTGLLNGENGLLPRTCPWTVGRCRRYLRAWSPWRHRSLCRSLHSAQRWNLDLGFGVRTRLLESSSASNSPSTVARDRVSTIESYVPAVRTRLALDRCTQNIVSRKMVSPKRVQADRMRPCAGPPRAAVVVATDITVTSVNRRTGSRTDSVRRHRTYKARVCIP